jgi:hypothetical protein
MSYPETLYTALVSFFTGAAAGCAFCMLAASALHRLYRRWRFSALCVLLSAAIVSLVLLLVLTPFSLSHLHSRFMLVWCIVFFAGGVLCAVYYRIIFPVVVLYGVLSLYSYYIISRKFPLPRKAVCVAVSDGTFSSGTFSEKLSLDTSGAFCIALDVCTLPPELLLPFYRRWYSFHERSGSAASSQEPDMVLHRFFRLYISYMTGKVGKLYIPVPSGASAAVYTLDCSSGFPVLVRVL